MNPQISESDILTFTEKIDLHRAKYILTLDFDEFKSIFWVNNEVSNDGSTWDLKIYHKTVLKYLEKMISNKGSLTQKYKYGRHSERGRIYVIGFGVQSLQHRLRRYYQRGVILRTVASHRKSLFVHHCLCRSISSELQTTLIQN